MASKNTSSKNGGVEKHYVSAQQRKLRRQQVFMAVLGVILAVAMVAAAVIH